MLESSILIPFWSSVVAMTATTGNISAGTAKAASAGAAKAGYYLSRSS